MARKHKDPISKIADYYLMAILALLFVVGIALGVNSKTRSAPYNPMQSIVKLTVDKTDEIVCSGVRIAPDLIITNSHCVDGVEVRGLETRKGLKGYARVLWKGDHTKGHDLALLQTNIHQHEDVARLDCKAGSIVNGTINVGDELIAIGMPVGLSWTQTRGYVAAMNRQGAELSPNFAGYADLIQLNLVILGGNSGGGLFTLDGRFVGIPTLAGMNGAIAFAIPAKTICQFLGRSQ